MKIILVIAAIQFYPQVTFCQISPLIARRIDSQEVTCIAAYRDKNKEITITQGTGFIIDGKYFATCYHVFKPSDNVTLKDMYIRYNFKIVNGWLHYDSTFINLKFKSNKSQFHFYEHHLSDDLDSIGNDFVILKLSNPIPSNSVIIWKKKNLKYGDSLYAVGNALDATSGRLHFYLRRSYLRFVMTFSTHDCKLIAFLGNAEQGYSGALIYDLKGHPVGMIQSGWEVFPKKQLKGNIPDAQYADIENAYKHGLRLSIAIPLPYLHNRYMAGYYNDVYHRE